VGFVGAMRRVIIESPYAGEIDRNVAYARRCVRDSLERGEAPIASHLLYTQPGILNDGDPLEREWGINAGLAWRQNAEASVVYTDLGITPGMGYGIKAAEDAGVPVEYRQIGLEATYTPATIVYTRPPDRDGICSLRMLQGWEMAIDLEARHVRDLNMQLMGWLDEYFNRIEGE